MTVTVTGVLVYLAWVSSGVSYHRKWPVPPKWFRADIHCIGMYESGNGSDGRNLYGMLDGWRQAGGTGSASQASAGEQLYRAWLLYNWSRREFGDGWLPWKCCPGTARKCGF